MRTPIEHAEPRVYSVDDTGRLNVWNIKDSSAPLLIDGYESPRLRWAWESGAFQVIWNSQLEGYSLWSAPAPSGAWQLVSGPIETIEGQKRYSFSQASEQYFQLRR
jgi:hypothetical protein